MLIKPDWPAPSSITSLVTTREGGISQAPWSGFNLATHVGDDPVHVAHNRQQLITQGNLPSSPEWLDQTHSTDVINLTNQTSRQADASWTNVKNQVAVVLTADCLPLLLTNKQGSEVAAVHAGWKGLLNGIVIKAVSAMQSPVDDILVWLGPAISQTHFEVGSEVKAQFCQQYAQADQHFKASANEKYHADLYALARDQLQSLGVVSIYGGDDCSYADEQRFYSYRRDGVTGRMASLIWINS